MSNVIKNTGLLYTRSIIILIISLYSSRVLLSALGVDDYGLYNLVGGVVGLFSSLKTLFSFAVQRFLSFAKGEGNIDKEKLVFNVSAILHVFIALVFAILVESFGLWFIPHKLNIPVGSLSNAYFVFHISIVTAVISIFLTPFTASVIANEKMSTFAWISVLDAVLKLCIIILIPSINYIPIRTYALLLLSVELLNLLLYVISCRKFPECNFECRFDKSLFKEIASFAGWDFAGNTAWALINEGVNMVLNMFGGVSLNAARGIAYQVKQSVMTLVNNVTVASRPRIIKQAAGESSIITFHSINLMARALFIITLLTAVPVIVYAKQILSIWLVEVPLYTVSFVQLVLIWSIVRTMNTPIDIAFTAYGRIKKYQIFNSLTLILNLPLAYTFLKAGFSYNYAMFTFIIVEIIDIIVNIIIAKYEIDFDISRYINEVVMRNSYDVVFVFLTSMVFYYFISPSTPWLIILYAPLLVLICAVIIVLLLSKEEKKLIKPIFKRILNMVMK